MSVLAPPNGLEMLDPLAAPKPTEDRALFGQPFWRNEKRNGPTDDLFRAISENHFCAVVPAPDGPFQVLTDNSVIGRADDGGKVGSRAFSGLPVGDVHQHVYGTDERTSSVA